MRLWSCWISSGKATRVSWGGSVRYTKRRTKLKCSETGGKIWNKVDCQRLETRSFNETCACILPENVLPAKSSGSNFIPVIVLLVCYLSCLLLENDVFAEDFRVFCGVWLKQAFFWNFCVCFVSQGLVKVLAFRGSSVGKDSLAHYRKLVWLGVLFIYLPSAAWNSSLFRLSYLLTVSCCLKDRTTLDEWVNTG